MRLSSLSIVAACASTLLSVHANADRGGLADRGMQSIRRGEQRNAPVSTVARARKETKEGHWGGSLAGSEASQILFFRDYAIGACAYEAALQGGALGTVTFTSNATTFAGLIANGTEWDLIVVANQNYSNVGTFQQALVTYHAADDGCGIIVSEWKDTSAASYFPALGFSHNQPWNVFGALSIEPGSTVSGSAPVTLVDIGWEVWNTGTIGGGTAELRGTQSNVMSARNGKIIVNGFLSDTLSPFANGVDMVRRQMAALTRPPCNFGDCNNDGICDDGQLPGNDCNGNNVLDSCDIANGSATDCNGNGTPDSCELAGGAADCNGNGTLDSCELASGAATDCNGNGTLDSCDIAAGTPDCNGNGKPDSCDIQRGSATDCNGNGVPDSCDIIGGSANDVNQNGIPDSCEPDCNGNGIPDAYEVAGGFVADCDNNGQPDSCDIAGGAADCDTDGVLDSCELAAGAPDCNGNGVLDSCDIAGGTAADCNGNTIPDSCDLANGAPDCNANGIPDSCDIGGSSGQQVTIGFEEYSGVAATPITNQYPGLVFEAGPNGSQWTASDIISAGFNCSGWDCDTEQPNGLSAGTGEYWVCGRVACLPQNPYAGSASIRLTGSGATYFQLDYSSASTLYLVAFDAGGAQIDVDSGPANRRFVENNSSGPGTLRVEAPSGTRIASVTVHDSGNYWGIDSIVTDVGATSANDCDGNGVPDSCDLANGAPDCNGNGIQDSCDLASGAALDCNGNSVPDSCDLANGSAKDCNGNSIPDSCDIASGFSTDPEGDGIPNSCEPDPGVTMAGPGNAAPGQCSAIGDEVVFNVSVLNPPIVTVAGQFNVVYDRAVLEYVGISGGDAPITDILVSNHDAGNGSIFWISTIPNGGSGTLADLRVASLRFRVIADDCDGGVHASLDEGFAPVLIANDGGITADLPLTQPASFVIDTTGPVLSGVPADLTVPADAGSGCFAARELTPPSVIDNCGDADLVITRSDAQPLGAPWACGTTIVTWSATDGCGRTAQATTSVTVEPYHLLDLRLAYAGSGYASSMGRCIDIDLGDVEAAVAMTFAAGVGMETIQVPVGSYGCATADDDLHSLVSTGSVVIEGTRYVLALAGTSALVNGDVTDDNLVNVADWGVIVTRIGSMQPADVDCSTAGFHVDFNGDGAVTQADGDFIVASLLRTGATGCGALIGGSADEGSMSVDQLAAIAGPDAILADLNGDGMVDLDDVSLWAAARERRGEE